MENKRLFISLPVEIGLIQQIFKEFSRLNVPTEKLRLVPADNVHLTLKFLGDTPLDNLVPIIDILSDISPKFSQINLTLAKTQLFPKDPSSLARILNIAIEPNEELSALYEELEETLCQNGLANRESRVFKPHLTIARVKKAAKFEEFQEFLDWKVSGEFGVDHLELQETILEKKGPEYFVLNTFDLG